MNSEYKHYFKHQISAVIFTRRYLITESKIWINWGSEVPLLAPSTLVQVEELEKKKRKKYIRVLRSFFTTSAASNTSHKWESVNIKGTISFVPTQNAVSKRMKSPPSLVGSAKTCVPTLHYIKCVPLQSTLTQGIWILIILLNSKIKERHNVKAQV